MLQTTMFVVVLQHHQIVHPRLHLLCCLHRVSSTSVALNCPNHIHAPNLSAYLGHDVAHVGRVHCRVAPLPLIYVNHQHHEIDPFLDWHTVFVLHPQFAVVLPSKRMRMKFISSKRAEGHGHGVERCAGPDPLWLWPTQYLTLVPPRDASLVVCQCHPRHHTLLPLPIDRIFHLAKLLVLSSRFWERRASHWRTRPTTLHHCWNCLQNECTNSYQISVNALCRMHSFSGAMVSIGHLVNQLSLTDGNPWIDWHCWHPNMRVTWSVRMMFPLSGLYQRGFYPCSMRCVI